ETEAGMGRETEAPAREPTREEVDRMEGPVVLEFGARWCGFCRALAPRLAALLAKYPSVRHVKGEDGPGQPLGRAFQVKLWPTLVFLRGGRALLKVSRPEPGEVLRGLDAISGGENGVRADMAPQTPSP